MHWMCAVLQCKQHLHVTKDKVSLSRQFCHTRQADYKKQYSKCSNQRQGEPRCKQGLLHNCAGAGTMNTPAHKLEAQQQQSKQVWPASAIISACLSEALHSNPCTEVAGSTHATAALAETGRSQATAPVHMPWALECNHTSTTALSSGYAQQLRMMHNTNKRREPLNRATISIPRFQITRMCVSCTLDVCTDIHSVKSRHSNVHRCTRASKCTPPTPPGESCQPQRHAASLQNSFDLGAWRNPTPRSHVCRPHLPLPPHSSGIADTQQDCNARRKRQQNRSSTAEPQSRNAPVGDLISCCTKRAASSVADLPCKQTEHLLRACRRSCRSHTH